MARNSLPNLKNHIRMLRHITRCNVSFKLSLALFSKVLGNLFNGLHIILFVRLLISVNVVTQLLVLHSVPTYCLCLYRKLPSSDRTSRPLRPSLVTRWTSTLALALPPVPWTRVSALSPTSLRPRLTPALVAVEPLPV